MEPVRCAWYSLAVLMAGVAAGAAAPKAPAPPTARRPAVLAAVRLPFTSSSAPAVADLDGDGHPDIVVTSDNIGDITRQLDDPRNVNAVYAFGWRNGALRPLPGWPRPTRDAVMGVSVADLSARIPAPAAGSPKPPNWRAGGPAAGAGSAHLTVFAACGQDFAPPLMQKAGLWLVSRLYAWRPNGAPQPPWFPWDATGAQGMVFGHAYAAPMAADLHNDGHPTLFQSSQGAWEGAGFQHGSLRLFDGGGSIVGLSHDDASALPWRTLPGFAPDDPPVIARLRGGGGWNVVSASFEGRLYAWDADGNAVPGWFPSAGARTQTSKSALIRGGIAAADLDGGGRDEILAGAFDGALYCWNTDGSLRWRSVPPAIAGAVPPLTSGVAVGRLRRGGAPEQDIVAGDGAGVVTAWKPDGRILWRAGTTQGAGIEAEPAIGDVNGDGTQDVVIGGTDGFVYAFDGETGRRLWKAPTFWSPTPEGMRLESIFGAPALCDLRGNGHLDVVVPTAMRYIVDVPTHTWAGTGHVLVLDCGPGTYSPDRLDWPQYRQNAARMGHAKIR